MMNTSLFGPAMQPAIQCIQANGIPGFIGQVQAGGLNPALAFNAVGTAIDRYVGSSPPMDYPADLHSAIRKLPKEYIASHVQGNLLGLIDNHQAVVEKAVRIFTINAEAPFDLDAQWRWIPPGEFQMGSANDDPHADSDEKPLRSVMVGGFYMLDYTPTNAEYVEFLATTGWGDSRYLNGGRLDGDEQPAVKVHQIEALEYAQGLGGQVAKRTGHPVIGRLPTEEEWEKAAKGPLGDEFISPATRKQAYFYGATRVVDHPGAYANGYGLKDMMGNVGEWTSSPMEKGSTRVIVRGYSVRRAAARCDVCPDHCSDDIGFRPVLVP